MKIEQKVELKKVEKSRNPNVDNFQVSSDSNIETYSLSEVAKYLNVNEGTLRNWEKRFSEFLSNYRNQLNHRAFTEGDVKVLERIKALIESGLFTQSGVKHMLSNKRGSRSGGANQEGIVPVENMFAKPPSGVAQMDDKYKEKLLMALNSLGSEIHALRRETREDLKESLKREIEHLTLLLFPPEKPKRPWWKIW
ncbi:hypothetical protein DRH29_01345 [candidate division Kazan bacterium]|uniref:HTH merR-type domain-containing protein n=1 Tax=candidate division Kazan bacterium TaxID=2202143 RepID=A0A420ZDJ5_UNCK3|nr:MAG: hypothetical protein DRH29_01345 [candidate division Kazan bacterium]